MWWAQIPLGELMFPHSCTPCPCRSAWLQGGALLLGWSCSRLSHLQSLWSFGVGLFLLACYVLVEPSEWLGLGIAFPSWLWEQCPHPGIFPNQIPLDLNTLLIHRLAHRDPARSMTLDFILSVVGTEGEKRRSQISLFPCILMGSELYPFPTRADLSQTSMCP